MRFERLGVGALGLVSLVSAAHAQPVLFTGDAEADFGAGAVVIADPNAVDVGMPLQFPQGTISGNDIKDIRLSYDAAADVLYVGLNMYGIGTDVDSQAGPDVTGPILADLGGTDMPAVGGTESFALIIDVDEDGTPDLIVGVSGATDINGFTAAGFEGSVFAPGFAFGAPLAPHIGAVAGAPSAAMPDIEFTIPNWSAVPTSSGSDLSVQFAINAFVGSFSDAGIGEDFTPGAGLFTPVCIPQPETCNEMDDDCDGAIDEGFGPGQACSVGTGACAANGVKTCQPDGTVACDATPGAPQAETCNAIDDDCDGQTDERFGLGEICSAGVGACVARGVIACDGAGGTACDAVPGAPNAETCNGADDDCDGRNDEGLGLGQLCQAGVGTCAASGLTQCDGNGGVTCDAVLRPPVAERCNDRDDDCDGRTDESLGLGDACTAGVGGCAMAGVNVCAADGQVICDAVPGAPEAESCNGTDDDCDGQIDEGTGGTACQTGAAGACGPGTTMCSAGQLSCVQVLQPVGEGCDGIDNDCDGSADEDFNVGAACTQGVGGCAVGGSIVCDAAGFPVCDAVAGQPVGETCNDADDDCDGLIDEGFDLGAACNDGVGACAADGVKVCDGNGATTCSAEPGAPQAETCNGIDDDCDGQIDEGTGGAVCQSGAAGACGPGITVCSAGQVSCVQILQPVGEGCDGIDNDCDGSADEDFNVGAACTQGVGGCAVDGSIVCDAAGFPVCDAVAGQPAGETCNDADDDCDGLIDEGFDLGAACNDGVGACAADGVKVCDGNGATTCSAEPGAPQAETCNGIDDDCDGSADEGFNVGGACTDGVGACAANGTTVCDGNGGATCDATPGQPGAEACNAMDDDCDGSVDEGTGVNDACTVGTGACAMRGVNVCATNGGVTCDATPGNPEAETCNGIDDDCDGSIDEGTGGDACQSGEAGACGAGTTQCSAGQLSCVPNAEPGVETCDAVDNDCDGSIDEGFNVGGACTDGVGACADAGTIACDGNGGATCDANAGEPAAETCDATDNDCDGSVDEGFGLGDACREGVGSCAANGVNVCDNNGGVTCNAEPGAPQVEACNGADDDCDGSIDEGTGGDACQSGEAGACGAGTTQCSAGQLSCVPNAEPGVETCDAVDNDCDGSIDEGFNVGDACNEGVGACADAGTIACDGNGGATCDATAGAPAAETCNGIDDDCDGQIDEGTGGEACQSDGLGACGAGTTACTAGEIVCAPNAEPAAETCDAIDNDCDGSTDEGFGLGEACRDGVGACAAEGQVVCGANGEAICNANAAEPAAETCDATDNDCDGRIDEGFNVGDACRAGDGACMAMGMIVCAGGEAVCDAQEGDPQRELCDGIDNDCDGETDESGPNRQFAADEYAPNGHAVWLPNFYGDGARTRLHFNDDAVFTMRDDGTASMIGNATVFDGGVAGEVWYVETEYRLRGQGPAFGGPKIERPAIQPAEVTDQWFYYDMTAGRLTRGDRVAELVQRPADGRFPFQFGMTANGKNANLGAAVWFNWTLTQGGEPLRSGVGDFNVNLEPLSVCAEICDVGNGGPAPETCNNSDDDCDGVVDEGFGVDGACIVGVGACAAEGVQTCGADGEVVCEAMPGVPADEVCDGVDNDCDGSVDEGFGLGEACSAGQGECQATGRRVCDADGAVTCDAVPGEPLAELCDGLDNDCDGATDEEGPRQVYAASEFLNGHALWLPGLYEAGRLVRMKLRDDGELVIHEGVAHLTGTAYLFQNSGGPGAIGEEWSVDIKFAFRGVGDAFGGPKTNRPEQTPEVTAGWAYYDMIAGESFIRRDNIELRLTQMPADGRYPFQIGSWANMMNANLGGASWFFWDRYDDGELVGNGHGDVNLDLVAVESCETICDPAAGEPADEICDGRDNDCDGAADEGFAVGEVCVEGQGACGAIGETVCNPDGDGVICDAEAGAPADEICDAVDNDCDGSSDEALGLGEACTVGEGLCAAAGETVCDANGGVICGAEPGAPAVESCDALDNDCDGSSDEGLGLGDACTVGQGACAAAGENICDGEGGVTCSAEPGAPQAETCDGVDNDCDGSTDEGFGLGDVCNTGVGACAVQGTVICGADGAATCDAEPVEPGAELCDDIDNDCDGFTDEGFGVGDQCAAGQGMCRAVGERVCDAAGGVVCDAEPGAPSDELCDEEDNDCDGLIDEDFELDGDCAVGIGECRRDGQRICGEDDVVAGLGGNLVLNGSFENPRINVRWTVLQELEGWSTIAGNGIEIQRIRTAAEGEQYVELDSHPSPGSGCMMQVIPVSQGGIYRLGVSHSARPNVRDNRIAIYWDGVEVAELDADGRGLNDTEWTRYSFDVIGNDENGTLVFCDVTNDRNTLGGFVDDVSLEMVEGIMCDAQPGEPEDEACDGLDNDCDGQTDEDLGLGDDCQVGVGACVAPGTFQCGEDGDVICAGVPGEPADEACDDIDNDCDGLIDEGACDLEPTCEDEAPGTRIYQVSAWSDDAYGLYLPDWNERGHRTDMLFRDGATLTVRPDGTAELRGVAYVNSLGGGAGTLDEEWTVALDFELRGTGPEHGGPYRERPHVQPRALTDLWIYYDMVDGTLTRGDVVATLTQFPENGRFPFQMGQWANGRSDTFGASNWFRWERRAPNGVHCPEIQRGVGDMNINLDIICVSPEHDGEICNQADDDCDGFIDEGLDCDPDPIDMCALGEVYEVTEFSANGHAFWMPDFDGDGATVLMHMRGDGQFTIMGDEGHLTGTAYRTDNGDEYTVDVRFAYRGQGAQFGGPKIERARWQPPEVTDQWRYFDMVEATLMHGGLDVVSLTQMPADGRYPLQVGMTANGKTQGFGMASWFTWVRESPAGRHEGRGDINVNLAGICDAR